MISQNLSFVMFRKCSFLVTCSRELECLIDVTGNETTFNIVITAYDFMGGMSTLDHTLTRYDVNLPSVIFYPYGVKTTVNGQLVLYPNTPYVVLCCFHHVIIFMFTKFLRVELLYVN